MGLLTGKHLNLVILTFFRWEWFWLILVIDDFHGCECVDEGVHVVGRLVGNDLDSRLNGVRVKDSVGLDLLGCRRRDIVE